MHVSFAKSCKRTNHHGSSATHRPHVSALQPPQADDDEQGSPAAEPRGASGWMDSASRYICGGKAVPTAPTANQSHHEGAPAFVDDHARSLTTLVGRPSLTLAPHTVHRPADEEGEQGAAGRRAYRSVGTRRRSSTRSHSRCDRWSTSASNAPPPTAPTARAKPGLRMRKGCRQSPAPRARQSASR